MLLISIFHCGYETITTKRQGFFRMYWFICCIFVFDERCLVRDRSAGNSKTEKDKIFKNKSIAPPYKFELDLDVEISVYHMEGIGPPNLRCCQKHEKKRKSKLLWSNKSIRSVYILKKLINYIIEILFKSL